MIEIDVEASIEPVAQGAGFAQKGTTYLPMLIRDLSGRQGANHRGKLQPHIVNMANILIRQRDNHSAHAVTGFDKSKMADTGDRVAHGGAADAEIAGKFGLFQLCSG